MYCGTLFRLSVYCGKSVVVGLSGFQSPFNKKSKVQVGLSLSLLSSPFSPRNHSISKLCVSGSGVGGACECVSAPEEPFSPCLILPLLLCLLFSPIRHARAIGLAGVSGVLLRAQGGFFLGSDLASAGVSASRCGSWSGRFLGFMVEIVFHLQISSGSLCHYGCVEGLILFLASGGVVGWQWIQSVTAVGIGIRRCR